MITPAYWVMSDSNSEADSSSSSASFAPAKASTISFELDFTGV